MVWVQVIGDDEESTTLTVLLTNEGAKMPGFGTIHELVNAVSGS